MNSQKETKIVKECKYCDVGLECPYHIYPYYSEEEIIEEDEDVDEEKPEECDCNVS